MNLQKLFETQKILDGRIVKEHGLEGQNLLPMKILALQVELGELANEWRGFKFWSNNQEPRYERVCHACRGQRHFILTSEGHKEVCTYCEGTGIEAKPLLEEYVDCLHFFLSIGNDLNDIEETSYLGKTIDLMKGILGNFGSIFNYVQEDMDLFDWTEAFQYFLGLGELLGFTWEQVEQAYFAKNDVNHQRQNEGY